MSMKQTQTWALRREAGGGKDWSVGLTDACHIQETDNNKVLLCSTGDSIQYPVINHTGKESEKICVTESTCCTEEMNPTL